MSRQFLKYRFKKKRDYNIITPCCNKKNKGGKFVNFEDLPNTFGYCHSCGKTTLPKNPNREEFNISGNSYFNKDSDLITKKKKIRYVSESVIWKYYMVSPENNLLLYLRSKYGNEKVNLTKEMYVIGTCERGGTIFWNIDKDLRVKKSKISFYTLDGRRKNMFKVPYKNEDGYYSCLYGEHLLIDDLKGKQIVVLVESEKTAIVGNINMPQYTWLAYGGINGLTNDKVLPLVGHRVLIIPDISRNAVEIMAKKLPNLLKIGINAEIWDMTEGRSDQDLKQLGVYNDDLEDLIRAVVV